MHCSTTSTPVVLCDLPDCILLSLVLFCFVFSSFHFSTRLQWGVITVGAFNLTNLFSAEEISLGVEIANTPPAAVKDEWSLMIERKCRLLLCNQAMFLLVCFVLFVCFLFGQCKNVWICFVIE